MARAASCDAMRMAPPSMAQEGAGVLALDRDRRSGLGFAPMLPAGIGHFKRARITPQPPMREAAPGGPHAGPDDERAADDLVAHPPRGHLSRRRRDRVADRRRADPPLYLSRRARALAAARACARAARRTAR